MNGYNIAKASFFNDLTISKNETLINLISELKQYLYTEASLNKYQKFLVNKYLQMWKQIFNSFPYNGTNSLLEIYLNNPNGLKKQYQTFPYPINYMNHIQVFANFDIEYINSQITKLPYLLYSEIEPYLDKNDTPNDIHLYNSSCLNAGDLIAVESSQRSKRFKIIDGNHREYFIQQNNSKDFKVRVISLFNLNENMFINRFNFAIYLFYNNFGNFMYLDKKPIQQYKELKKCKHLLKKYHLL